MSRKVLLVDKYIFKEVWRPYLIGVIIITIVMLSNFLYQVADMVVVEDVPVPVVLRLIFYRLPEIAVETFPVAVLFAIMSGLGRLNREREFAALQMGGFSIYRLIVPLIVFGVLITAFTYGFNESIVPASNQRAHDLIRDADLEALMPEVRENIFFEGPEDRIYFIEDFSVDDDTLDRIVVFEEGIGPDEYPRIITAPRGEIADENWELYDGHIHSYDEEGYLNSGQDFSSKELNIARQLEEFTGAQRTPAEMSREELLEEKEMMLAGGVDVTELVVEYHMRTSLPFAALIFVLVGTPLSLGNKDSRALSLALTIIIVFLYYILVSFGRAFGINEILPPLAAAWMPNLLFGLLGILLMIFKERWSALLNSLITRIM